MPFFVDLGYAFALPENVHPHGSFLLASSMPMHQLERRRFGRKYPHLENRIFDPQLYLAGINPATSPRHCANLSSYPWFGIRGLQAYDSGQQTLKQWRDALETRVSDVWTRNPPSDANLIAAYADQSIDFQIDLGCSAIVLPSPLTTDPAGNYTLELLWLDSAIEAADNYAESDLPIFATIALSDVCLRNSDPDDNPLLDLILDNVSAREIDGVYIVLDQTQEPADTRQCGDSRSLWSILHLTHIFSRDAGLNVMTNFFGQFGLAARSAGASTWGTGWYKSLHRIRLADALAGGRAYPYFWSNPAAVDIHLEGELNQFAEAGLLDVIRDETPASVGLLQAVENGVAVSDVPAWRYAPSNIASASEHYLCSCAQAEETYTEISDEDKLDFISEWLEEAVTTSDQLRRTAGEGIRTKTAHVRAWNSAFTSYRRSHSV